MKQKMTTPAGDGFYMPAEYAPHRGCVMIWPTRPGTWTHAGREAQAAFIQVAQAIAQSEPVWMLAAPEDVPAAEAAFSDWNAGTWTSCAPALSEACESEPCGFCESEPPVSCTPELPVSRASEPPASCEPESPVSCAYELPVFRAPELSAGDVEPDDISCRHPVHILAIETDDAWARDIGPTCVVSDTGEVRGVDWQFNAWGGTYDGLYAEWAADNRAASGICAALKLPCYNAQHFVLEGGAIQSDGEGTVLVTEACLLSPGRNPQMDKSEIEQNLRAYLGARKVVWLPHGIWQDETNEHVDNVCAFVGPAEVVLAWTDDANDPQYELSLASLRALEAETDAKGRPFRIHKLPIPANPVCATQAEAAAIEAAPGEEARIADERLAASYVNFYVSNGGVIVPQFGDAHDALAVRMLAELFPERIVYPVDARAIIIGGGNIHCITQNIPR